MVGFDGLWVTTCHNHSGANRPPAIAATITLLAYASILIEGDTMTIPTPDASGPDDPDSPAARNREHPPRLPGGGLGDAEVAPPQSGLSGLESLPDQRRPGEAWGAMPEFSLTAPREDVTGTGGATDRLDSRPSHASIHIEPHAAELADVRAWTRDYLRALPNPVSPTAWGDIEVVVDELVSNAIQHGTPPLWLSLTCHLHSLLIAVEDSSPTSAVTRTPDNTGGRGLHLLDAVAKSWGQTQYQHGAKTVWAEMPLITQ